MPATSTKPSTVLRPSPPLDYSPIRRSSVAIARRRDIDLSGLHTRYMHPGEIEMLVTLVDGIKPRGMIEIGCNSGRTAKAILRNVSGIERYVGIDVPASYVTGKQVQRREVMESPGQLALDDPRFRLMVARRGSLDLQADDLQACDCVFIDGDHSREAVLHDYGLARRLVRPGGLIVFHDDHGDPVVDVSAVLDELADDEGADIHHVAGTWLAFERVRSTGL